MSRMRTLIPVPVSVAPDPAADFALAASTPIVAVDGAGVEVEPVAAYLAEVLHATTGFELSVVRDARAGAIELRVEPGAGYRLDVTAAGVTLAAATAADLFAGVQTLRQLLPVAGPQWTVAGGRIADRARYDYRGAMLDVSRHFFTVAEVRRHIDLIAQYKVNHLHLHLTDDQGWRLAIRRWPRLAEHGGATQMGGGPGGYYTQEQYREIVAHAAARHITVVPEIDLPGHTTAALSAYPELTVDGVDVPLYTGTSRPEGFSSLDTDRELTYRFVAEVLGEVAELTPGPYLHIGTDETHATPEDGYRRFVERVVPIVEGLGKTVVGWQEMVRAAVPASAVVHYWGRGADDRLIAAAAARGNPVIMSPNRHAYLDMKYTPETPIGFDWAGHTDVERSYAWDPETVIDGLPPESVLGVEGPLWTETVERYDQVEFMTFPRLAALAEIGWSPRSTHDWADFRRRLAAHGPRLAAQDVNFYRSGQIEWE